MQALAAAVDPAIELPPESAPLVTYSLLAACALVWVAMVATGVSPMEPAGEDLLKWGADYGPQTLAGEWWRAFTCIFVHIGVLHLLLNLWCLWDLGSLVERLLGRSSFLFVYLLAGLGGNAASLWWNPEVISAGASGAVFGLAGGLASILYARKLPIPQEIVKKKLSSVTAFIGYNVFYGLTRPGIDNAAHLGGLGVGLLLGLLVPLPAPAAVGEPQRRNAPVIFAAVALAVGGGFWYAASTHAGYGELEQGRQLMEAGQLDAAIEKLRAAAAQQPASAEAHFLLGQACMGKKLDEEAIRAFRRTIELLPQADGAHLNLGVLYLRNEQIDSAIASFRKAAAINPQMWQAHFNLGLGLGVKEQYAEAVAAFQKAAALQPQNPEVHGYLGRALLDAGQTDRAITSLKRATELKPDDADGWGVLAQAYARGGKQREALDALARQSQLRRAQPQ